jgi:hypothetical protein
MDGAPDRPLPWLKASEVLGKVIVNLSDFVLTEDLPLIRDFEDAKAQMLHVADQ